MAASFFFYDLETSGINPRDARIMQFAGQRTDMELNPIGEPVNILVKLTPDVLPEPDAVMITGITPQATLADGVTEAAFLKIFYEEVVLPGTIFLGFNTVRFDDEFMRYLHYRNFYDAYEWQWCDDCSRWDLLDLVRMTRALRPEGIEWPFVPATGPDAAKYGERGRPTNKLELLTQLNGVSHERAHDALSDVLSSIAVAKLIRDKQRGLFDYLMDCRGKREARSKIEDFFAARQPFLYCSGRYPSEFLHTTAVVRIGEHPSQPIAYVYDLRHDPARFQDMTPEQLADCARYSRDPEHIRLPVKSLKYNRCPAIAPMGILGSSEVQQRLDLTVEQVQTNRDKLHADAGLMARLIAAHELVDAENNARYSQADRLGEPLHVDGQLYEGLFGKEDCQAIKRLREAEPAALRDQLKQTDTAGGSGIRFGDKRLQALLPLYKARNYPQLLTEDERAEWDGFCRQRLLGQAQPGSREMAASPLGKYFKRLDELARQPELTADQRYALEELHLYGESVMPEPADL